MRVDFQGTISFLESVPHLEAFSIIHRTIDDISPIHVLQQLRSLKVHTYCTTQLDFSQFPKLKRCVLEWRRRVDGLFESPCLEDLWINRYDRKHTDEFSRLRKLERLSLANAPTNDLGGLADLDKLTFLGLYRLRRLETLDGIESLRGLLTLELQECSRIHSLHQLGNLHSLRRLLFTDLGEVKSISFLDGLKELEEVLFYGSTNIEDGDLTPLLQLPKLKSVAFQNRRHYSHKREQFAQS